MSDPLRSSRLLVQHAKKRREELEREVLAFLNEEPYTERVDLNADGTYEIYKVVLAKPLPDSISLVASEVANHLRNSLDHAAFATAVAAKGAKKSMRAAFPFGEDAADILWRKGKKNLRDLPPEMFDFMLALKPYRGGNARLVAVNAIANLNKHEVLVPAAMQSGLFSIDHMVSHGGLVIGFPNWDTTKNEMEIYRVRLGSPHPKIQFSFSVAVAFKDVDGIPVQPAEALFRDLIGEVDRCLAAIEAEARRLGLFPSA